MEKISRIGSELREQRRRAEEQLRTEFRESLQRLERSLSESFESKLKRIEKNIDGKIEAEIRRSVEKWLEKESEEVWSLAEDIVKKAAIILLPTALIFGILLGATTTYWIMK